ncbi:SulP family inorganic anion transporter [Kordiimonas pumila]|uniref:SulP family inorganic anion transporter n=1 Tax=Kordiimonas pumila TaxID=2161677 RepID=A0ABV7D2K1_9PROT|nr:SulP family inorganic anion transporter [Kordiimonas pumila]
MASQDFTPKLWTLLRGGYSMQNLRADFTAGLTVAVVALPLAMAIGIASGASPDKGLVTAIVAGFLISLLGGSRVQIGGPTGAFIVVVFNVIAEHGYDGLLLATILAGFILILAGYARFGQVIRYIPYPVVTGFTAGIAVIIASSQVQDFFGLSLDAVPAEFLSRWAAYVHGFPSMSMVAVVVGLSALFIILGFRKWAPSVPGNLVAVAVVSLGVYAFHMPVETIADRFPNIAVGLPTPQLPAWDYAKFLEIIPSAFTIAFLAGIEALLSAMVADGMTGYRHRPGQELVGQGVANIVSALFAGLPATGAIARTAVNIKSGAKTPIAGMFHAAFILAFVVLASDVMGFIPLAVLSAILFVVAWNMSEVHHFVHILKMPSNDRFILLLTFFLTVLVDLTVAIGVGVTLASLQFLYEMSKSESLHVQGRKIRDDEALIPEDVHQRDALPEGVEVFRFMGPIFFGMADRLADKFQSMVTAPKVLIVRMKLVPYMDVAGVRVIGNLVAHYKTKGTVIIFTGLQAQPKEILEKADIRPTALDVLFIDRYEDAVRRACDLV